MQGRIQRKRDACFLEFWGKPPHNLRSPQMLTNIAEKRKKNVGTITNPQPTTIK